MGGPGESLRQEREARGKTIEEVAEATGIHAHLLTSLEQEAFDSLPGRGFGKLYIRAYAEVLGFDPRPVIDAYDRAVRGRETEEPPPAPDGRPRPVKAMLSRWRQELIARRAELDLSAELEEEAFDPPEEVETEPAPGRFAGAAEGEPGPVAMVMAAASEVLEGPTVQPVSQNGDPAEELVQDAPAPPLRVDAHALPPFVGAVPRSRPARLRLWPVASLLLFVLLALSVYLVFFHSAPDPPSAATRHDAGPQKAIAPPRSLPSIPQFENPDTPARPPTPAGEQAASSSLEVTESGLGLRLVGARLEGMADRFRPGQRVTFVTRVVGGGKGETIRHVWLRDGKVEQAIPLRLGGANWRTWSTKTLGRPGAWAVEARDERGRVLARTDLAVVP